MMYLPRKAKQLLVIKAFLSKTQEPLKTADKIDEKKSFFFPLFLSDVNQY